MCNQDRASSDEHRERGRWICISLKATRVSPISMQDQICDALVRRGRGVHTLRPCSAPNTPPTIAALVSVSPPANSVRAKPSLKSALCLSSPIASVIPHLTCKPQSQQCCGIENSNTWHVSFCSTITTWVRQTAIPHGGDDHWLPESIQVSNICGYLPRSPFPPCTW